MVSCNTATPASATTSSVPPTNPHVPLKSTKNDTHVLQLPPAPSHPVIRQESNKDGVKKRVQFNTNTYLVEDGVKKIDGLPGIDTHASLEDKWAFAWQCLDELER